MFAVSLTEGNLYLLSLNCLLSLNYLLSLNCLLSLKPKKNSFLLSL